MGELIFVDLYNIPAPLSIKKNSNMTRKVIENHNEKTNYPENEKKKPNPEDVLVCDARSCSSVVISAGHWTDSVYIYARSIPYVNKNILTYM